MWWQEDMLDGSSSQVPTQESFSLTELQFLPEDFLHHIFLNQDI